MFPLELYREQVWTPGMLQERNVRYKEAQREETEPIGLISDEPIYGPWLIM